MQNTSSHAGIRGINSIGIKLAVSLHWQISLNLLVPHSCIRSSLKDALGSGHEGQSSSARRSLVRRSSVETICTESSHAWKRRWWRTTPAPGRIQADNGQSILISKAGQSGFPVDKVAITSPIKQNMLENLVWWNWWNREKWVWKLYLPKRTLHQTSSLTLFAETVSLKCSSSLYHLSLSFLYCFIQLYQVCFRMETLTTNNTFINH